MLVLPIYLIILVLDVLSVSAGNVVSRAIERIHHVAVAQTRSLARDLRITFGSVLVNQGNNGATSNSQHVVYCKVPVAGLTANNGAGDSGDTSSGDAGGGGNSGGSSDNSSRQTSRTRTRTSTSVAPTASAVNSPWKLTITHAGKTFFDQWDFFTPAVDPTAGNVDYVSRDVAFANGLASVNAAGNAIMRLETTKVVPNNRQSVRIHSKKVYNGGLIVLDAIHMPYGCGTWPAFWTNGPAWPNNGEIDILEGVHDYTNNQATLHTRSGCTLPSSDHNAIGMTGSVLNTNCATEESGNQACGTRSASHVSYGAPFNRNGGGVYAMKWDSDGIAIYFFEPQDIPADLEAETPLPATWGLPQAKWPPQTCDPFSFFKNHIMIFDTTLCGQWAGSVWDATGAPGQEQSCAVRTGYSTCEAYIRANGDDFEDAYWEVKSVKVYELK